MSPRFSPTHRVPTTEQEGSPSSVCSCTSGPRPRRVGVGGGGGKLRLEAQPHQGVHSSCVMRSCSHHSTSKPGRETEQAERRRLHVALRPLGACPECSQPVVGQIPPFSLLGLSFLKGRMGFSPWSCQSARLVQAASCHTETPQLVEQSRSPWASVSPRRQGLDPGR